MYFGTGKAYRSRDALSPPIRPPQTPAPLGPLPVDRTFRRMPAPRRRPHIPGAGAIILNMQSLQRQRPQTRNISSGSALEDGAARTAQGDKTTADSAWRSGGVVSEEEEEEEEEVMAVTRGRKERRDSVTESIVKGAPKAPTRDQQYERKRVWVYVHNRACDTPIYLVLGRGILQSRLAPTDRPNVRAFFHLLADATVLAERQRHLVRLAAADVDRAMAKTFKVLLYPVKSTGD